MRSAANVTEKRRQVWEAPPPPDDKAAPVGGRAGKGSVGGRAPECWACRAEAGQDLTDGTAGPPALFPKQPRPLSTADPTSHRRGNWGFSKRSPLQTLPEAFPGGF